MGKIPNTLREVTGRNIRYCRLQKYPGRGGGKQCAAAFGVSPQQWSPWENGMRIPSETRLAQLAEFFGVTVEWLRRDNHLPPAEKPEELPPRDFCAKAPPQDIGQDLPNIGVFDDNVSADTPAQQSHPAPPGSPASLFWLIHHFFMHMEMHGLRLDKQSLEYLAHCIRR